MNIYDIIGLYPEKEIKTSIEKTLETVRDMLYKESFQTSPKSPKLVTTEQIDLVIDSIKKAVNEC